MYDDGLNTFEIDNQTFGFSLDGTTPLTISANGAFEDNGFAIYAAVQDTNSLIIYGNKQ